MAGIRRRIKKLICFTEFLTVYTLGRLFGLSLIVRYLRNPNPHLSVRLLRSFGAKIGHGTTIKRSLLIDNAYEDENSANSFQHLNIGTDCYIGDDVYFDLSNKVIVADNAVISGRVSFITHADCNRSQYLAAKFPRQCKPIYVAQGAWVGFGATILAGVTIGECAVVAANTLVKKNIDSKAVYAGLPARKIRSLDDVISKERIYE